MKLNINSENQRLRGILLGAAGRRPMTRDELLSHAAECYCEDGCDRSPAETEELTHTVRSLAGTVLSALYREKKVTRDDQGRYSLAVDVSAEKSAEKSAGKSAEKSSAGKPSADKPSADKSSADKSSADKSAGKKAAKQTDRTAQAAEKPQPAPAKATKETKKDPTRAAGKPSADKATASKPSAGKAPASKTPAGKTVAGKTTASRKSVADKPSADRSSAGRASAGKISADRTSAAHALPGEQAVSGAQALPGAQALSEEIMGILSGKPLRRGEIFRRLDETVGVGGDTDAMSHLHQAAGDALKTLKRDKRLTCSFGVYRAVPAVERSASVVDRRSVPQPTGTDTERLRRRFLARLYARGGAYLEHYAMNLLIKFCQDSGKVIRGSQVTGGSSDGGIDGILEITDWLGFRECIMIQTKCRGSIQVTEKEIREFYGVVCSRNGSRGIFITTSTFHESAQKLLSTIDNCVGVDGEKLFLLACRCHYGIRSGARGDEIDPEII